jgi:hypothetical protein
MERPEPRSAVLTLLFGVVEGRTRIAEAVGPGG